MKIPQLARYNGTVFKAYNFVEENIVAFPVNLFALIDKFGWGLITYEEMALSSNCTIKDICMCLGKDGYSIYNGYNYTIAYNNKVTPKRRINFTLAHEIGHIILNHHKDFEITSTANLKDNFTIEEYKILENEANCFARNILAPAPLVAELGFWNIMFKLSNFFDITSSATRTRISFLKNDLYYLNNEQINNFQIKYKRFKHCFNCNCTNLNTSVKFCPLCGNKKLIMKDGFTMKEYKGINIRELGECPRCENYDLQEDDKFCKICGLSLINKCSICGIEVDSSARYCTECGNRTTYFEAGLLKKWHEVADINNNSNSNSNDEFVLSFPDDDLPF